MAVLGSLLFRINISNIHLFLVKLVKMNTINSGTTPPSFKKIKSIHQLNNTLYIIAVQDIVMYVCEP